MSIKRIASLFALTAAIAAVPAAAPSTFASISPTAAFAGGCYLDGAPVACEPGPGEECDPHCGADPKPCGSQSHLVSREVCDFPLTDVPRETVRHIIPPRTYPRGR